MSSKTFTLGKLYEILDAVLLSNLSQLKESPNSPSISTFCFNSLSKISFVYSFEFFDIYSSNLAPRCVTIQEYAKPEYPKPALTQHSFVGDIFLNESVTFST